MDRAPRESEASPASRRNRHLAMLSHDLKSALTGVIGESGQFELNIEVTNLEGFLAEIYRRWTARAEWKNLSLKVYMDGDLPKTVELDRGRLSRVLGNLLDNAIKYTESGKVELSVQIQDNTQLSFTICDDGTGFSEEALDSLFEFRGRPANSTKPGSGLGLYISQSLLSQMGGEIKVCNRPGRGAEAVVTVETEVSDQIGEDDEHTASVSVFPSTKLPDLSGLSILLAEDNITNQMVVTQMLDAMGAQFEIASDGVEALEKFEVHDFDVLLLDIEMPRLSGLDVIRAIRSRTDKKQAQTIIALTAYAMREHREKISVAGADGLIAKPILGIEDFGVDILNYHQCASGDVTATTSVTPIQADASTHDTLVDMSIYSNLENTIGKETMDELLSKVSTDFISIRDGISGGLENQDKRAISASSHMLISVAGAIGAVSTQEAAQALNKAGHHSGWTEIANHAETCLTNIEELLRFAEGKIHR